MLLALLCTGALGAVSWLLYRGRARKFGVRWLLIRTVQCVYSALFRAFAAILRLRCTARAAYGALPPWENPRVFKSNSLLAPHTPLRTYGSLSEALHEEGKRFPFVFDRRRPILERRLPESQWTLSLDTKESDAGVQSGRCPGWHLKLFRNPSALPGSHPPDIPPLVQVLPDIKNGDWVRWSSHRIRVPGCWEMQGHDYPIYTNVQFPWLRSHIPGVEEGNLPTGFAAISNMFAGVYAGATPKDYNPTAIYRRKIDLPAEWAEAVAKGERCVVLALQSVASAARIFVNGIEVGYTQDSFTESEVDITDALLARGVQHKDGHLLGLQVMRWSDGSWLEDQDHWWLSGLHRSVRLHCRPTKLSIKDFRVRTLVDSPYGDEADATLEVQVEIGSSADQEGNRGKIRCTLFKETTDGSKPVSVLSSSSDNNETNLSTVSLRVKSPAKWSPERPYLYTLGIELLSEKNAVIQVEVVRVGFRDVRISRVDDVVVSQRESKYADQRFFLLNNVPCVIAGANLHEHDPRHGKTVSQETMLLDLVMMKQNNFNAVRMSHYPHAHRLYELCDELGLMVCDEANIETHGFALSCQLSYLACHPDWEGALMQRIKNMAYRARNYSSVVTWSLGNESGCGPFHEKAAAWIREFDPTRTLQYEGGRDHGDAVLLLGNGRGADIVTDFVCPMYDSPNDMGAHARDPKETRPAVLCEYSHAMGNSNGGLHVYWDGFWNFDDVSLRSLQGGYMWDWVDQGLLIDADGLREGYGGDFGPGSGTGDAQFCMNGIVSYNRKPHPGMTEFKHCQSPVKFYLMPCKMNGDFKAVDVIIKNRYRNLDLSHLAFKCAPIVRDSASGEITVGPAQSIESLVRHKEMEVSDDSSFFFPGGEYIASIPMPTNRHCVMALDITAELSEDTDWADRGHIVAREVLELQLSNQDEKSRVTLSGGKNSVRVSQDTKRSKGDAAIVVKTQNYSVEFDKNGNLIAIGNYLSRQEETFGIGEKPFSHCFVRASTDNDNGGLANEGMGSSMVPYLKAMDAMFGTTWTTKGLSALSYATTWKEAGLIGCRQLPVAVDWTSKNVLRVETTVQPHASSRTSSKTELFHVYTEWTFNDLNIIMTARVVVGAGLLASRIHSIPRVGVRFLLDKSFNNVEWYGRGPEECYPDRKRGSPKSVYNDEVDSMHVGYTVPGECGGRADVRWVRMSRQERHRNDTESLKGGSILFKYEQLDADNSPEEVPLSGHSLIGRAEEMTTIRPAGSDGAQVSISRFSLEELHRKKHNWELVPSNCIHLHIDTVHMGLGGDTSWSPQVHRQFQINADTPGAEWNYRLTIVPE